MIQLTSANGKVSYGVNEYIIDTDTELANIPKSAEAGSTAYSVSSGSTFIKGNDGNWSVKNAGTDSEGGSTIVELPDNLLYSYEMTEEEFWDAYSAGNLNDGLYSRIGEIEMTIETSNIDLNLHSLCHPVVYNDSFWAVSYEIQDTLLQFDQDGNLKQQICISELLKQAYPDNYFSPFNIATQGTNRPDLTENDTIAIDKNGFLYLFSSNYFFTMDTNNILNCQISYQDVGKKIFRRTNLQGSIEAQEVSDGGIFCIDTKDSQTYYYKNGMVQQSWSVWPKLCERGRSIPYIVNYDTNQLFQLRYEKDHRNRTTHYIYTFNCNNENYQVCQLNLPTTTSAAYQTRMIFKNNYLYIQFILDELQYVFILDINTNTILQEEQFSLEYSHEGWSSDPIVSMDYIYSTNDYSIILNKMSTSETPDNIHYYNVPILFLFKFYHNTNQPYMEPLQPIIGATVNTSLGLSAQCQNNKLLFFDTKDSVTKLFNLNTGDIELLDKTVPELLNNNCMYKQDANNSILVMSYSHPTDINILQINTITGNVNFKTINIHDYFEEINVMYTHNTNILHYDNSINAFIFGDIVFDKNTLIPKYYIKNRTSLSQPFNINDKKLYRASNKFGQYKMGTDRTITSTLMHNNQILLSKSFY